MGIQIPIMENYTLSQHAGLDLISWYRSGFIFFPFDWVGFIPEQFQYSFSAEFPLPFPAESHFSLGLEEGLYSKILAGYILCISLTEEH